MNFFRNAEPAESDTALRARAATWQEHAKLESLTEAALSRITRAEGIDFATALLFDRFQKSSQYAPFIQRIDSLRQLPPGSPAKLDAKIIIVPGALYIERPELGGDGHIVRQVAETFGYETELIPVASFGSVSTNAALIRAWMEKHRRDRMIFVSLSKGGADLKMALGAPDAERLFGNVIAWVNVCGPLNGSPIADWILSSRWRTWFCRAQCVLQGRDFRFITDLRHDHGTPSSFAPCLPPSMKVLNLIGFPLRRHLTTRFSRFCHRTLAAWGPNDGTTCLSDLSGWPGEVYPVWGSDHYFRPEALARDLIAATLCHLSDELHPRTNPVFNKVTSPAIA